MFVLFKLDSVRRWNREKGKWVQYAHLCVALTCCFLTLSQLEGQISESIRILCYILCMVSCKRMKANSQIINREFDTLFKKILCIVLEAYGTFAMTGMYIVSIDISYTVQYTALVYFLLSFVWVYPIMQNVIALLIQIGENTYIEQHDVKLRTRLFLMGIIMVPCIVFLIAFNPAITSNDSALCYLWAHQLGQPEFSMADWHPPFYVLILRLLVEVCDSVSFVVFLQCLYFAAVFVDGVLFLYQCGLPKKLLGIFYCFIAFGISNMIQLVTLWKDIPYMISLMWLTILLMKFIIWHNKCKVGWGWYIQFIFAVVFTAFFRQNGILPAVAVIILLPAVTKWARKVLTACIVCALLIVCIKGPLYQSMNVVPRPQLKFFSLANDIMYSYYYDGIVSDEAMEMINKITENNPNHYKYNAFRVYYNWEEPKDYSVGKFMGIYFHNVWQNPILAVKAVLTRNTDIWSIARPAEEPVSCVNYLDVFNDLGVFPERTDNVLTYILTVLCGRLCNNSLLYIFYWRTGIYNLFTICMAIIIWCKSKGKKILYMLPLTPILANLAALFISSGWTDYRYFWPSMTISLFLFFYFVYVMRTQRTER